LSFARSLPPFTQIEEGRSVALDVHQTFCEVAIWEEGKVRSAGRVRSDRAELELFAQSLDPSDKVAMEATGPAMEIARILEPHVAKVIVANAQELRAISHARVKSDSYDARTLAQLLHAGMLESVWVPDATIQALRRRSPAALPWFASAPAPRTRSTRPWPAACSGGLRSPISSARAAVPGSPAKSFPPRSQRRSPAACARSPSSTRR
jgi:Transposase